MDCYYVYSKVQVIKYYRYGNISFILKILLTFIGRKKKNMFLLKRAY
jgi:hypothetical protein